MTTKLAHKKIKSYKTSRCIFVPPGALALICTVYLMQVSFNITVFLFVIFANLLFLAPAVFQYKYARFVVSNRKIYIKHNFFKTDIALDLVKHLCYFKYTQNLFGLVFNYGTFEFVDDQKQIYRVKQLPNPKQIEYLIVEQTNNYLKDLGIEETIGEEIPQNAYEKLQELTRSSDSDPQPLEDVSHEK